MKLGPSPLLALLLAGSYTVVGAPEAHGDDNDNDNDNMMMAMATAATTVAASTSVDWEAVTATPWAPAHVHGVPIADTQLTPEQHKYWDSYNTTTYLTIDTPYKGHLHAHLVLLFVSAFVLYPFVLVLNNLESNWFLPLLAAQASLSLVSCVLYSVFISNVPDLYPNMAYTKMITGLFVLTLLQVAFAVVFSVKRWLYPNAAGVGSAAAAAVSGFQPVPSVDRFTDDEYVAPGKGKTETIQMNDFCSPSSTLFDDDNADTDSFNLEEDSSSNNNTATPASNSTSDMHGLGLNFTTVGSSRPASSPVGSTSHLTKSRNSLLQSLSSSRVLASLASSFGTVFTILHNVTTWALLAYFFALFPTAISCLNLFGKGQKVFNLLAHFIKGGIFFILGLISLARYCGCFSGIGGAWNYAYVDLDRHRYPHSSSSAVATVSDTDRAMTGMGGAGSGGSNVSHSVWIRIHQLFTSRDIINRYGGLICSFEFVESFLIFLYGASNVFLEHLASTDGVWTAKDLQHVSIAFMYFGAGLCGLISEFKLSSWRRSLFFNVAGRQLAITENIQLDSNLIVDDQHHILGSNKLITPGFSPNPFPVFTIFWTGILMSKHAQASSLSTEIHVQWGSLLTYGSFFRVFTFILMSYYPLRGSKECFLPSKPLTELVTSFCLLCGGMVFMESTDQVIEALAWRGLTPMFTINVSVGVISLVMAWVMFIFAVKDRLRANSPQK